MLLAIKKSSFNMVLSAVHIILCVSIEHLSLSLLGDDFFPASYPLLSDYVIAPLYLVQFLSI